MIEGLLTTSDGQNVAYHHYKNGHAQVAIIAHGFFNSKQALLIKEFAGSLNDAYDMIAFDFRGHGKSKGLFYWTAKEYQDLLAVIEYAHRSYATIGVVGFSLGAATSIIAATKTNFIKSVVAISAPTELRKVDYHFWDLDIENDIIYTLIAEGKIGTGVRSGPFWEKKEKPIALVNDLKAPILYIHGDKDWVIRPWHSKRLYENTRSEKDIAIIKNGPHAEYLIRKNKHEIVALIKDWFVKTLEKR